MSALAFRKISEYERIQYIVRTPEGIRLLFQLMKPSTTPEIAADFQESYISVISQTDLKLQ